MRVVLARLVVLSGLAVALCCGWFAMMELLLRHDGYLWRAAIAAAIAVEALLTMALSEELFQPATFRWPLTAAAAATGVLGGWIIADDLARPAPPAAHHFEGYLLIVGLTLVACGALTVLSTVFLSPRAVGEQ